MAKDQKPIIISGSELQARIGGKRYYRKQKIKRILRIISRCALVVAALAVGFLVTETLLRISETPLSEGVTALLAEVTTQPLTTARPMPEGPPLHTFYVPLSLMDDREQARELMEQAEELGTNAAVMLFKDSGGYLSYKSDLMQQRLLNASQRTRWRTDWTLYDLKNRSKQKIIAVIHCFNDSLAAGLMPDGAVLLRNTEQAPWKDSQGKAWLNPYSESAQEYLLAVMREVIAFGAGEIMLCGVQFPTGDLQAAVFPGEEPDANEERLAASRNKALLNFLKKAKAVMGEKTLYCMLPFQLARNGGAEYGGSLWEGAADVFAIDMRGTHWTQEDDFWKVQPVMPVVDSIENANGARDYIVLEDEVLQARY